jgi:hypothetical protein
MTTPLWLCVSRDFPILWVTPHASLKTCSPTHMPHGGSRPGWQLCAASQHMPRRASRRPLQRRRWSCGRYHKITTTDVVWARRVRRRSVGGCPGLVTVVWAIRVHDRQCPGVWSHIACGRHPVSLSAQVPAAIVCALARNIWLGKKICWWNISSAPFWGLLRGYSFI